MCATVVRLRAEPPESTLSPVHFEEGSASRTFEVRCGGRSYRVLKATGACPGEIVQPRIIPFVPKVYQRITETADKFLPDFLVKYIWPLPGIARANVNAPILALFIRLSAENKMTPKACTAQFQFVVREAQMVRNFRKQAHVLVANQILILTFKTVATAIWPAHHSF